jgi:hypothetical protein
MRVVSPTGLTTLPTTQDARSAVLVSQTLVTNYTAQPLVRALIKPNPQSLRFTDPTEHRSLRRIWM